MAYLSALPGFIAATVRGRRMVSYWHGSQTALPVGTHLTPLRERKGSGFSPSRYQHLSSNDHDPDLVYFTTDRELARAWCMRSKGALLRGTRFSGAPLGVGVWLPVRDVGG